jgi:protein-disulfide isomerase
MNSFAVADLLSLIFSVVGAASVGLGKQQTPPGMPGFLDEFKNAPQVFLPPEAFGGPQAKGVANAENAVLDIVEFSDFQCPACRMAAQLLRPLLLKHKDKVRFSYRHFPLDGSCNPHAPNGRHGWACATARASICAANQNKFWEFHDLIFDHQDELSASRIDSLAKEAGLDMEKMASCLKDPSTESQLQKEMQWGELIGLESTPTLIINGRRFAGARPHSDLEALMQQIEREKKR